MISFDRLFSFQIFFIFLRESLEIVIIVSILLTIVKQALSLDDSKHIILNDQTPCSMVEGEQDMSHSPTIPSMSNDQLYNKLKLQILSGGALGILCCMLVGSGFIFIFYFIGTDLWSMSEHYYEGILSILASIIISVMGLFFLRMGKLREKFRVKLASIIYSDDRHIIKISDRKSVSFTQKYAFFILPFVTALREGLEAVIFIGGIGINQPLTSIPLSMISAASISLIFGYVFFNSSKSISLQICLVITTCFLYLISAGLLSKGVWQFEVQRYVDNCNGQDMTELGNGSGSYDISRSIWHVNCCNGERDGGWMILTAIFGWTNSATYSSVISYCMYWLVIIAVINILLIEEKHGYIPFLPLKLQRKRILKRMRMAENAMKLNYNGIISDRRMQNESESSITPLLSSFPNDTTTQ